MSAPATPSAAQLDAWRELNLLLLRSAVEQAVHCHPGEIDEFRRRTQESAEGLTPEASPSQILIAAGALAQSVAHYNRQVQQRVDAMSGASNSVLHALLEHLGEMHTEPECQIPLEQLRDAIENGPAPEKVNECLAELRLHATEKRQKTRDLTNRLQDRVTILEQSPPLAPAGAPSSGSATVDPCTGLPVRAEAEAAIRRALAGESPTFVAVFYLHRMALTNARFGEAIGNQVILFASQHLATTVTRNADLLFRWTGPAFVAVLERTESLLTVSNEMQRGISSPLSRFFETPTRSVYLPIKITGDVFPMEDRTYAEMIDQVERFILQASGNAGRE